MRSDHKALLFLAGIAILGAMVRVARAVGTQPAPGGDALAHQMQAADSAKRSIAGKRAEKLRRQAPAGSGAARVGGVGQAPPPSVAPSGHRDYKGRLDLDVAGAAEIDSLPGVGPALAKRIAANRMAVGPFRELAALRRVKGVNAKLLTRVDTLVSFSGAYKAPITSDTVIPPKSARKRR
jgi:competence protein ComEA